MVESYRQTHGPKRPPASARLGILLGLALVAFVVLGLILRALGAGAVLLGLVLFALGLALGWHARGRREPAQKVAALPVRPANLEPNTEKVSPARAYALQVLELNTSASTGERLAPELVESDVKPVAREKLVEVSAEPVTRAPEPMGPLAGETLEPVEPVLPVQATPEVGEPRAGTTERKKWSPRVKVQSPSSTPETPVETTVALAALETTPLETESPVVLEPVTLEPVNLEPATIERKKWMPKSSESGVLDTLSRSQPSSLEPEPSSEPPLHSPVTLEASAYPEIELPEVKLPDINASQSGAPARKKWIPKVKREGAALENTGSLELPEVQTALEPISSAKLNSRQILENMGIHLPTQTSSAPPIQIDSSTPDSSELQAVRASSGRKKWVPRRKA